MANGLGNLQVYRNALQLSELAWNIYLDLPNHLRYDLGSQLLRAVDSIGANIAEGYGRFHYKDKIKFYYNACGSLWESKHWIHLFYKREIVGKADYEVFLHLINATGIQLNNFIKSTGEKTHG